MRNVKLASGVTNPLLGPLEEDILKMLWTKGTSHSKELYILLRKKRKVAHTSVAVMLDRLHEKKLVKREIQSCRGGYKYIYAPSASPEDFKQAALQNAVDKLIESFGNTAVAYFNERFGRGK